MKRLITTTSVCVAFMGCDLVGLDYEAPNATMMNRFVGGSLDSIENGQSLHWWTQLNDPVLNKLVERGAVQNIDIQIALERIRAAEAALQQTGVNNLFAGSLSANEIRSGTDSVVENSRRNTLSADYVLDLFGGAARDVERASAEVQAAQADAGAVRLAYLAEITAAYTEARYFQTAADITRQAIRTRQDTLNIAKQRRDVGEATTLEVKQAEAQLAAAQADLPILSANFETRVFGIATLLAEPAHAVRATLSHTSAQPLASLPATAGIPADLLRNRPDILAAERRLAAATAAVGVAEAQLYPSLSLGGLVTSGSNQSWSFGPSVNIPVLNRGQLRAGRAIALSNAKTAELAWRNAIIVAVEEVQNAMVLHEAWQSQMRAQSQAVSATQNVLALSRESYEAGEITLADVLDAERGVASSRLALANARQNATLQWMSVNISSGQGWRTQGSAIGTEVMRPVSRADPLGLQGTSATN